MASRSQTLHNLNINQENVKNQKLANMVPGQRRAALGEIGNKVITQRTNELKGLSVQPTKDKVLLKKPVVTKPAILVRQDKSKKVVSKQVSAAKPQIKTQIKVENKTDNLLLPEVPKKETKTEAKENHDVKNNISPAEILIVEDIDEEDKKNPILVSVYSNDIYKYLRKLEIQFPVRKGYLQGQEVTPKMRCVLIDWLIEVHEQFHLMQETLFLTVAIIDRFLQDFRLITRKRLQLVGVTAMFIASKYEEMYSPDISDFVYITDNAYNKAEILQMEKVMIKTLEFSFGRPLPVHFLRRYSKAGKALPVHHTLAKYFLEQCLIHYEVCHYPPSLIAAAAIYLSFLLLGNDSIENGDVIWSKTLEHYSTYDTDQILPVAQDISTIIMNAEKSKYQAARRKYTNSKHMKISLRPELKSPTMIRFVNHKIE